jgi:hypothetical protein
MAIQGGRCAIVRDAVRVGTPSPPWWANGSTGSGKAYDARRPLCWSLVRLSAVCRPVQVLKPGCAGGGGGQGPQPLATSPPLTCRVRQAGWRGGPAAGGWHPSTCKALALPVTRRNTIAASPCPERSFATLGHCRRQVSAPRWRLARPREGTTHRPRPLWEFVDYGPLRLHFFCNRLLHSCAFCIG